MCIFLCVSLSHSFYKRAIPTTVFSSFPHDIIQIKIDKRIDGVLKTQTWGSKMEGADISTELWRHPFSLSPNYFYTPRLNHTLPPDYSNSISLLSVYLSLSLIFYSFQSLPNKLSFLFSQTLFTLSLNHTKSSHPFPLTISMYVPDNYFGAFLKNGPPQPLFRLFSPFPTNITIFTANICEKCPLSMQCWDSNPQPSEHESPPVTTRPGLIL